MVQNELLIDILTTNPQYILGADKLEGMSKVLRIYGEISGNRKLYN